MRRGRLFKSGPFFDAGRPPAPPAAEMQSFPPSPGHPRPDRAGIAKPAGQSLLHRAYPVKVSRTDESPDQTARLFQTLRQGAHFAVRFSSALFSSEVARDMPTRCALSGEGGVLDVDVTSGDRYSCGGSRMRSATARRAGGRPEGASREESGSCRSDGDGRLLRTEGEG